MVLNIAAETGKDYSVVISALQANEIDTLDDLFSLEPEDFTTLGFSIALKNKIKKIREQWQADNSQRRQEYVQYATAAR